MLEKYTLLLKELNNPITVNNYIRRAMKMLYLEILREINIDNFNPLINSLKEDNEEEYKLQILLTKIKSTLEEEKKDMEIVFYRQIVDNINQFQTDINYRIRNISKLISKSPCSLDSKYKIKKSFLYEITDINNSNHQLVYKLQFIQDNWF